MSLKYHIGQETKQMLKEQGELRKSTKKSVKRGSHWPKIRQFKHQTK